MRSGGAVTNRLHASMAWSKTGIPVSTLVHSRDLFLFSFSLCARRSKIFSNKSQDRKSHSSEEKDARSEAKKLGIRLRSWNLPTTKSDQLIERRGYRWVNWQVPHDNRMLLSIGRDLDGLNLVVGRAMHQGDMLPAKVKPEHGVAYVCHGGVEHVTSNFEVLLPATFSWIHAARGHVPPHAVEAGRTADGEILYVGRTYHQGVPCVGKVHRSHGVMYIPYDGKEIPYRDYEVLVQM